MYCQDTWPSKLHRLCRLAAAPVCALPCKVLCGPRDTPHLLTSEPGACRRAASSLIAPQSSALQVRPFAASSLFNSAELCYQTLSRTHKSPALLQAASEHCVAPSCRCCHVLHMPLFLATLNLVNHLQRCFQQPALQSALLALGLCLPQLPLPRQRQSQPGALRQSQAQQPLQPALRHPPQPWPQSQPRQRQ